MEIAHSWPPEPEVMNHDPVPWVRVRLATIIIIFKYILIISDYYNYNMTVADSKYFEYRHLQYDMVIIFNCIFLQCAEFRLAA
jgi:hypothetical protein